MSTKSEVYGSFGLISFAGEQPLTTAPLPSSEEMRKCDRLAIEKRIPSVELMDRAATACVEVIREKFPGLKRVLVLCGPGNNGGDGLEIAALLQSTGVHVSVVASCAQKYSAEWQAKAAQLEKIHFFPSVPISPTTGGRVTGSASITVSDLKLMVGEVDLIVDALLGIGQREAPRGSIGELLGELLRVQIPKIFAVDVPTGLNADTGELYNPHLPATVTVAIQAIKRGTLQFPGRAACGELIAREIGIDTSGKVSGRRLVDFEAYFGQGDAALFHLNPNAHKGTRGHVLVIGSSRDMPGAAALAARAALRGGAGLVTVAGRASWDTFSYLPPEVMRVTLTGSEPAFGAADGELLQEYVKAVDAVVLGPGLGESKKFPQLKEFTSFLLHCAASSGVPLVLDASGLTHMVGGRFPDDCSKVVITPHPGEAARLLEVTNSEVQRDRFSAVTKLSALSRATALLKGAGTLIYGSGRGYLIPRGTPYLATAGSGDVLTGVIGAYLARGIDPVRATCAAAFRHAVAGEKTSCGPGGFTATDLIESLREC